MSIETGKRYFVINKKSETMVDLDDHSKTVQCWTLRPGLNQQWDFIQVDGGWKIRNAQKPDAYLSFEGNVGDGTKVEGLSDERIWHIWPDKHISNGYRICVLNTVLNLDLADFGKCDNGTLQLWKTREEAQNQVWGVKEVKPDSWMDAINYYQRLGLDY